jgi:hypothetical protein
MLSSRQHAVDGSLIFKLTLIVHRIDDRSIDTKDSTSPQILTALIADFNDRGLPEIRASLASLIQPAFGMGPCGIQY